MITVKLINFIIKVIAHVFNFVLGLLPQSPFIGVTDKLVPLKKYMGYCNYFLPISWLVDTLVAFLGIYLSYLVFRIILKFIKVV